MYLTKERDPKKTPVERQVGQQPATQQVVQGPKTSVTISQKQKQSLEELQQKAEEVQKAATVLKAGAIFLGTIAVVGSVELYTFAAGNIIAGVALTILTMISAFFSGRNYTLWQELKTDAKDLRAKALQAESD